MFLNVRENKILVPDVLIKRREKNSSLVGIYLLWLSELLFGQTAPQKNIKLENNTMSSVRILHFSEKLFTSKCSKLTGVKCVWTVGFFALVKNCNGHFC